MSRRTTNPPLAALNSSISFPNFTGVANFIQLAIQDHSPYPGEGQEMNAHTHSRPTLRDEPRGHHRSRDSLENLQFRRRAISARLRPGAARGDRGSRAEAQGQPCRAQASRPDLHHRRRSLHPGDQGTHQRQAAPGAAERHDGHKARALSAVDRRLDRHLHESAGRRGRLALRRRAGHRAHPALDQRPDGRRPSRDLLRRQREAAARCSKQRPRAAAQQVMRIDHKIGYATLGQFLGVLHRTAPIRLGSRVTLVLNQRSVAKPYVDDNRHVLSRRRQRSRSRLGRANWPMDVWTNQLPAYRRHAEEHPAPARIRRSRARAFRTDLAPRSTSVMAEFRAGLRRRRRRPVVDQRARRPGICWPSHPLALVQFLQFAGAALVFLVDPAAEPDDVRARPPSATTVPAPGAAAVGFVGLVGTMVLQYLAFALMPVVEANLIAYTWPLMVAAAVIASGTGAAPDAAGGRPPPSGFVGVALVMTGGRDETLMSGQSRRLRGRARIGTVHGLLHARHRPLCRVRRIARCCRRR